MRDHKNVYPGFEPKYDNDGYPDLPKEPTVTISCAEYEALMAAAKALQVTRDWIGSMPTMDSGGNDTFLRTAAIVHQAEDALAALRAVGIQIEGE
jgi:hypothetical protein